MVSAHRVLQTQAALNGHARGHTRIVCLLATPHSGKSDALSPAAPTRTGGCIVPVSIPVGGGAGAAGAADVGGLAFTPFSTPSLTACGIACNTASVLKLIASTGTRSRIATAAFGDLAHRNTFACAYAARVACAACETYAMHVACLACVGCKACSTCDWRGSFYVRVRVPVSREEAPCEHATHEESR